MSVYRATTTRSDRIKAIAGVIAVHAALGTLMLIRADVAPAPQSTPPPVLIEIAPPPPPPPEPIVPDPGPVREEEAGAAGVEAEPTPIVAPKPRIVVPTVQPVVAATIAGTGTSPNAGAATAGTGPGAGGTGDGRGGGGAGGGGGIGEDARLLSGGLDRRDYRHLRSFAAPSGRAMLAILIGPDGRVVQCTTRQSSGDPALDAALCAMLRPRMRWAPARDRSGRPLTVGIIYTAVWSRD